MQPQTNPPPILPKNLLTCLICNTIFVKPITLSCGHTFCRQCIRYQIRNKKDTFSQEPSIKVRQKLNKCFVCSNIIWKDISAMHENLVIQNLVNKFYCKQVEEKVKQFSKQSNSMVEEKNSQKTSQFYNKILIKIKQPSVFPMPSCYSQVEFCTAFIDDVIGQSHSLVFTWDCLLQKNLGLLCTLLKVQPLNSASTLSKIIYNIQQSDEVLQQKYKGMIQGLQYVKIDQISTVSINLRHKLIIIGQQKIQKIIKNLQISNCTSYHSQNYDQIQLHQFDLFLKFYDSMNNHHYLQQIRKLIFDTPFQTRNNTQLMIYCTLRILKIPNQLRKKLVLYFDDRKRMQEINAWLVSHQNFPIQDIINIKIPGKYNTGLVLFIIFILLAFNLFQDYNNRDSNRI